MERNELNLQQVEMYRDWLNDWFPGEKDDAVYAELAWCDKRIGELIVSERQKEQDKFFADWVWAFENQIKKYNEN